VLFLSKTLQTEFCPIDDQSSGNEVKIGAGGIFMSCDVGVLRKFEALPCITSAWSHATSRAVNFINIQVRNAGRGHELKIAADGACGLRVLYLVLLWLEHRSETATWRDFELPDVESTDLYNAVMKLLRTEGTDPVHFKDSFKRLSLIYFSYRHSERTTTQIQEIQR
jgi:hypothetical protein